METNNRGNSGLDNQKSQNQETDRDTNKLGNSSLRNEGRLGGASGNYDALHNNQHSKHQMAQNDSREILTDDDNDYDFDNNDLDEKEDNDWDDDDNWNDNETDTDLSRDRDL